MKEKEKVKGRDRRRKKARIQLPKYSKNSIQIAQNFSKQVSLLKINLSIDTSCTITLSQTSTFGDDQLFQYSNKTMYVTNKVCCKSAIWEVFSQIYLGIYLRIYTFTRGIRSVFKTMLNLVTFSFHKELITEHGHNV